MKDRFFLDTNILVYSFDHTAPTKRDIARNLIGKALTSKKGFISFQVIQEFVNVATRKFEKPLTTSDTRIYLHEVLSPLNKLSPDFNFYNQALVTKSKWRYSWYDSLIITAAIALDSKILYTEDMQHNQELGDLTVINPFKADTL